MIKAIIKKVSVVLTVVLIIFATIFDSLTLFLLTPIPVFCGLIILARLHKVERGGVIKTLALCPQCNKIVLVPIVNQKPCCSSSELMRFQKKHLHHGHIFLEVIFGPWRKGKTEDPMVPNYLVARHHRSGKIFLIERSKKKVNNPMRYKILASPTPEIKWHWRFARLCLW